ncbi:MAG: outer membrane lipoprotein-sorting protein [Candidatus Aminicenantaceae bacterium]|jgi:outer membrane lipoprotein-sorting protein|nr:outer membrane lipoprotein-sorting protein [Candidatus Heimdallarchaeota archaeon]
MKRIIWAVFIIFMATAASIIVIQSFALQDTPSGEWILQKLDENIGSDNKIYLGKMIIHGRRGSRTVESKSWIQGDEKSFTEYLAPPREKGTKMLKLGDQLWTYSPSTDRTIKISGHMLRQSVMGSDLSYEDMMEDRRMENLYNANVVSEELYEDRPCWVLELTAKEGEEDIAYHSRKVWVDKERYVALKEERFAKSGKLLKTTEVKHVSQIENRWVPDEVIFRDVLKAGKGTEFTIDSIEFNATIPDHVFSKASLR